MASDLLAARGIIHASTMPQYAKEILEKLLDAYGVEWHLELFQCENRLGSGSNTLKFDIFENAESEQVSRVQQIVNEFLERAAANEAAHGKKPKDPLEAYREFLEGFEYFDWEEDFEDERGFSVDLLSTWHSERVDFYRSIQSLKLAKAREASYIDLEALDLGGREEACRTCGVFFHDNLNRHSGVESLYCSLHCQTNAVLICIQCQNEFTVGKSSKQIRLLKLSGFCSLDCNVAFRHLRDADSSYRSSMRRKATAYGVAFDDDITRRLVFKKAGGICYLCKSMTQYENSEEYNPLLATVDHVIPWTRGGSHTWDNVELSCLRCNIIKKDR